MNEHQNQHLVYSQSHVFMLLISLRPQEVKAKVLQKKEDVPVLTHPIF